jgi:hypothetical protein
MAKLEQQILTNPFKQARERFENLLLDIEIRINKGNVATLEKVATREFRNVEKISKAIKKTVATIDKDEQREEESDIIPLVLEEEWRQLFEAIHDMDSEATNGKSTQRMTRSLEMCIRKLCGKVKSKQRSVHGIMIKAAKLHDLSFYAEKVFRLIHPHFCNLLEDVEELDYLMRHRGTSVPDEDLMEVCRGVILN